MKVVLKKGREKSLRNNHPWIFSGAILEAPKNMKGEIYEVYSAEHEKLGEGFFNSNSQLIGRMLSFGNEPAEEAVKRHLKEAIQSRIYNSDTNAYRLVNGEGDFLPGLIIDKYDDLAVIQIGSMGMERLKPLILESLPFNNIYEKSDSFSRKEEGLKPFEGWLKGASDPTRIIKERGIQFKIELSGQKTGFFLDMREMRALIQSLSKGKRVLNTFSYSGGFTLSALKGDALNVTSVDISQLAIDLLNENIILNSFKAQPSFVADVFEFLREKPLDYDIVVLDPPAFAKKAKDVVPACRGYKDLNRIAMKKMPKNSLLLTASCSHHVDEKLFQQVVFQASREANREVQIVEKHRLASDHPINIACPESAYLKSLLLKIN